jgi:hypothetical protein
MCFQLAIKVLLIVYYYCEMLLDLQNKSHIRNLP